VAESVPGLVSTVIPVRDRAVLLREAVASALVQSWPQVEVIVVDDGSTDDTPAAAGALAAADPRVRVIHQANAGPAGARQAGLEAARGEFIQYLDSDDLLAPQKFRLQVEGLRAHPQCGASYGCTRRYRIGDTPRDVPIKRTGERIETLFPALLESRFWSTSTPLYRRAVCEAAGPWRAELRNEEDWEYECRIAALGTRLHHVPAFLSDTRDHARDSQLHAGAIPATEKLCHRARAHELILGHARRAGIGAQCPQMQRFARELFLLSRQCGAAGLAHESARLFALAREASGARRGQGLDFRLYHGAALTLGWIAAGRLSAAIDRLRSPASSHQGLPQEPG